MVSFHKGFIKTHPLISVILYVLRLYLAFSTVSPATTAIDPCYNYTVLDDTWRSISNTDGLRDNISNCDTSVSWSGWYRLFINNNSAHIPDTCVAPFSCGTDTALWIRGGHPTVTDGVVTRDVCGYAYSYCCAYGSFPIKVKACPDNYYVYELVSPTFCDSAYCADTGSINTSPTTVTPVAISPDPCYNYTVLDDTWRSINNTHASVRNCDKSVSWSGWYRLFINNTSAHIPDTCVAQSSCGADIALWIRGGHPTVTDGVVTRDVCGYGWSYCCFLGSFPIKVKACPDDYYVYELVRPTGFCSAYCADTGSINTSPTTVTPVTISPGVSSDDWSVSYSPSHICALKDSTVIMRCTYTYPTGYQIMKVFWTNESIKGKEPPDLSNDTEYSQRLQYLGDKQQNCTVRLSHVTLKDSHMYYFRFITDKEMKWTGAPGVTLTVTDLQVESPERVTEGDSVNLRCKSSCALTDRATFIWYRNSQPLTERRDRNNELLLQSVRREDSGRYSCAVDGHTHISPAVQLNVMYSPRNVSVSISPSGVIVEGDSVTLNCISDSNPPAEISWFKGKRKILQSGETYNITNIKSESSGDYHCSAINKHGSQTSAAVNVNIMYPPRNVSVLISGSGVIVEGYSVTLNCISDSNPPAEISWIKGGTIVGSGRIYSISKISSDDSGEYKCKSINEHGEKYSDAVTLNVMYPPRSVSVSISPSGVIVEGDSVTLNCISDSNPPAEISWFKGGTIVGSGRVFSISKISSDESGEYKCKSINKHGGTYSDTVTLNVMYPPRSVSVSISPSGVIVEGDSVTLSCISDSNPPAEISWFKGGTIVGSGRIFSISKISSDDSGEYKCKSINEHGEKYSDNVTLNVFYSPRNVSVSISPSGVIMEGDSVTLNCIRDSNPPALNFSWIKGGTIVGSGRIYSISKISSDDSGEYKCKSINEHGGTYSDTVTLNVMCEFIIKKQDAVEHPSMFIMIFINNYLHIFFFYDPCNNYVW
ncbi:hypothetical protein PO909_016037 [Leuciscus waleckii]